MSAVVDQTAESKSASQDDQMIGDLKSPATGDSLYPSKKRKTTGTEEEEKTETVYYTGIGCENCKELSTREFVAMSDDEEYECDYLEDEGLRLRVINHKRSIYLSGGFYVDCLPDGFTGGIYNRDHFCSLNFDKAAEDSARSCIATYNKDKTIQLDFKKVVHITAKQANDMVFYLTFEALDPEKKGDDKTETYQAVVCYSNMYNSALETLVFRRKSDGEDLLDPDPLFGEWTRTAEYFERRMMSGGVSDT